MNYEMLTTQEDINYFMNNFNYFHDSCIKEIKYISGGFVGEEKGMFPINSKKIVNIIFQSQNAKYPVIEMQFSSINKLNLEPKDENYDCIIYRASLKKIEDLYYWSEWSDFEIGDINEYNGTWIVAKSVKWRALNESALGLSESQFRFEFNKMINNFIEIMPNYNWKSL